MSSISAASGDSIINEKLLIVFILLTFVLFVKNMIIDKRPLFTLLLNWFFVMLTLPCLKSIYKFDCNEDNIGPNSAFCGYFGMISMITTIILSGLAKKNKMKKGTLFSIGIIIMTCMFFAINTIGDVGACILYSGQGAKNTLIQDYINCIAMLLLQVNLSISYINANWDCFKKKSGEILDSKE